MDTRVPSQSSQPLTKASHVNANITANSDKKQLKRSLSMVTAMAQPNILQRPSPVGLKVRNAGKEFLKHDQTCHWIQFMQNPDPLPPTNRSRAPSLSKNGSAETQKSVCPAEALYCIDPVSRSYYETQLLTLLKRQEDLALRQQRLEEELVQQKKWQEQQPECPTVKEQLIQPLPLLEVPSVGNHSLRASRSKSPAFRRRLKGSVAKFCAQRNEGSLEKVLYYRDNPTQMGDSEFLTDCARRSFQSSCSTSETDGSLGRTSRLVASSTQRLAPEPRVKGLSPASVGRRHAMAQESGLAVSQLITQAPRLFYSNI